MNACQGIDPPFSHSAPPYPARRRPCLKPARWVLALFVLAGWHGYPGVAIAVEAPAPHAITVQGGEASESVVRALADAFNAAQGASRISVAPASEADTAIEAVLAARSDFAHIARALSQTERKLGLREFVVAREAVVFATGTGAGVDSLTVRQLALIFSGATRNWSRAGGAAAPIRVLYREESEPLLQAIRAALPAFAVLRFSTDGKMVIRDQEMIDLMRKFRYAAGWGSLSRIRATNSLRVLALDGVTPGAQSLASARYPLRYNVTLVYRQAPAGTGRDFLDFVYSDAGRKVIQSLDALPVARE